MAYYIPGVYGSEDLVIDAIVNLLTEHCQTQIATGDVSRAQLIKAGYRQASPESVSILVYENDPDDPTQNTHRPLRFPDGGYQLVGGGSIYSRAFTLEVEVYGGYMPIAVTREESRRIASIVERRAMRALQYGGPHIGTGGAIQDDFGETIVDGPFMGRSWTELNEGESLIVIKYIRFWYVASSGWNTSGW